MTLKQMLTSAFSFLKGNVSSIINKISAFSLYSFGNTRTGKMNMIEIERKFLVISEAFKNEAFKGSRITQGFLSTDAKRVIRIRIKGDLGYLTIKGKSNASGLSRFEWEKEISVVEAQNLLNLCEKGIIDKIRYEIKTGEHIFEVDEFLGDNKGLVIAEVELNSENEAFEKPDWLGKDVTGEIRYYNSQLSQHPYKNWNK